MAEALRVNSAVQQLNLGWNKISDEGATALAEALRVNSALQELECSLSNKLSAVGARALAKALRVNRLYRS